MRGDLHTHTTFSDGLNEPAEIVKMAKKVGFVALAITDHDSILGIDEAIQTAIEVGNIEIVPGIEMSTIEQNQDIHILGYYIDYKDEFFLQKIAELQKSREERNIMMINKLNESGVNITMSEVFSKVKRSETKVGRPHIAEVLIEKGIVKTMQEAFNCYLGRNGKAYVNTIRISPEECIDIINDAGGVAVIAHPGIYNNDQMVIRLIKYGLAGIEVYHPDHNKGTENRYRRMAKKYNILATGGSDFHGTREGMTFHSSIGAKSISYDVVKKLKDLSNN